MKKIVLMYHDVYDNDPNTSGFIRPSMGQYKINCDIFEKQVHRIKEYITEHRNIQVVFSFDDGGCSFYSIIAPILENYGFRGLFFICPNYINQKGFLTSDQIIELEHNGHIIGSHSYTHPDNITVLSYQDEEMEWRNSLLKLEEILGHKVNSISIPNGYFEKRTLSILKEMNISEVYTSEPITKVKRYGNISVVGRFVVHSTVTNKEVVKLLSSRTKRFFLQSRWLLLKIPKKLLGKNYNKIKQFILR